jgi:cyclase
VKLLKRIIFCLYYKEGFFYLSRNFSLQKVGDVDWLIRNFGFGKVTNYIDEIIIILVKRKPTKPDFDSFFKDIIKLRKNLFIPITLGGGIRDIKISNSFFDNGADKILINTLAFEDNDAIEKIAGFYGSQAICIMIDHKKINGEIKLYSCCGTRLEKITLKKHIENLNTLSCGEIILNSIDNDGNAAGIDLSILDNIGKSIGKPILIMGGAGKPEHLSSVLTSKKISGVITANLFNFLGDGLKVARNFALENNIRLAKF